MVSVKVPVTPLLPTPSFDIRPVPCTVGFRDQSVNQIHHGDSFSFISDIHNDLTDHLSITMGSNELSLSYEARFPYHLANFNEYFDFKDSLVSLLDIMLLSNADT